MPRLFAFAATLLAGLAASQAGGADPLRLDVPRAIEMALARNFQIEVASFQPRIAESHVTQELGRFDPRLEAGYSRSEDTDRRSLAGQDAGRFITRTDSADIGVTGLLPWGTRYDFGAAVENGRDTGNDFEDQFSVTPTIGATQPLLRGFGTAANLADVRIARTDARISEWVYRQRIIDVITQVYFVYNELYFSMENLQVAQRSRGLAQQLLRDNEQRAEIGVMSPLDVTTARADFAAREEAVLLARRSVRDNENFLKQLITDDIDALLARPLLISPPPSPQGLRLAVPEGIRAALDWRPDYRQALLDIRRQNISLAFARNQALPRLDLSASLDLIGFDSGFSSSVGNALNRDRTEWSAGAIFSVPIPNREGRGSVNAAQLRAAQALVELKRLEQDIVVRVDNASGQIETNRERIESTAEARKLAQESLDAGGERLRAGSATTFELLELQTRLSAAEAAELRARADYNKAAAEYDRQTGLAIERNGVTLR